MPIEIRELNIRINVNRNQQEQDDTPEASIVSNQQPADNDQNESEIMEKVMEVINNKEER